MGKIKKFYGDEAGNATEYGLIVALASLAIISGALVLGAGLDNLFRALSKALP